jgi:hypothetical protein
VRGFYDAGKDGKVPTTKNIVWPEIIVAPKDTTNKQATRKRTTQKEETNKRDYESHNETNGAKPLQKL